MSCLRKLLTLLTATAMESMVHPMTQMLSLQLPKTFSPFGKGMVAIWGNHPAQAQTASIQTMRTQTAKHSDNENSDSQSCASSSENDESWLVSDDNSADGSGSVQSSDSNSEHDEDLSSEEASDYTDSAGSSEITQEVEPFLKKALKLLKVSILRKHLKHQSSQCASGERVNLIHSTELHQVRMPGQSSLLKSHQEHNLQCGKEQQHKCMLSQRNLNCSKNEQHKFVPGQSNLNCSGEQRHMFMLRQSLKAYLGKSG